MPSGSRDMRIYRAYRVPFVSAGCATLSIRRARWHARIFLHRVVGNSHAAVTASWRGPSGNPMPTPPASSRLQDHPGVRHARCTVGTPPGPQEPIGIRSRAPPAPGLRHSPLRAQPRARTATESRGSGRRMWPNVHNNDPREFIAGIVVFGRGDCPDPERRHGGVLWVDQFTQALAGDLAPHLLMAQRLLREVA